MSLRFLSHRVIWVYSFFLFFFNASPLSLCQGDARLISSSDCKSRLMLFCSFRATTSLTPLNPLVSRINHVGRKKDQVGTWHRSRAVHITSLKLRIVRNEVVRCYKESRGTFFLKNILPLLCCQSRDHSGARFPIIVAVASFQSLTNILHNVDVGRESAITCLMY